jgi:hypothetical protein
MDDALLFHTTTNHPDAAEAGVDKMSLLRLVVWLQHRQQSIKDCQGPSEALTGWMSVASRQGQSGLRLFVLGLPALLPMHTSILPMRCYRALVLGDWVISSLLAGT